MAISLVAFVVLFTCLTAKASRAKPASPQPDRLTADSQYNWEAADNSIAKCETGAQLAAAIVDTRVSVVLISANITLSLSDWASYALPVPVDRNLTLLGAHLNEEQWPLFDGAYVKGLMLLRPSIQLNITRLVLINARAVPHFQAPGLDFVAMDPTAAEATPAAIRRWPTLLISNAALIQPICLPASLYRSSSDSLPRAPEYPGTQKAGRVNQSADCVNSTAPRTLRDCWPSAGMYRDMATYGTDLDLYGTPTRTGYVVLAQQTYYLCQSVMSEQCAADFGLVGCFFRMFPSGGGEAVLAGPSTQPAPASAGGGGSGGDTSNRGPSHAHISIVAGVIGGCVGLALVASLAVLTIHVARRRRQRKQQQQKQCGCKQCGTGAGACCVPTQASSAAWRLNNCTDNTSALEDGRTARAVDPVASSRQNNSSGNVARGEAPAADLDSALKGQQASRRAEEPTTQGLDPDLLSLIPVTPLTPLLPDVKLGVKLLHEGEVQLLPVTLGKGAFGHVVQGMYGGQLVAVKLLNTGLSAAAAPAPPVPLPLPPQPAAPPLPLPAPAELLPPEATNRVDCAAAVREGDAAKEEEVACGVAVRQAAAAPEERMNMLEPQIYASQDPKADDDCLDVDFNPSICGDTELAQEVEVLARCRHPNVIRLLAANVKPPHACLVMELMDTSLERLMYANPSGKFVPLRKVICIAMQIARALSYLHPTILHRDLKPANVLISKPDSDQPVAKLADFGLSRLLQTTLMTNNPEVGTAAYMAPEAFNVLSNPAITDRADMYAFGVLLWELLAGQRPWERFSVFQIAYAICVQGARLPLHAVPESRCPPKLRALIYSCWEADPARRPAAAEAVKVLVLARAQVEVTGPRIDE